MGKCLYSMLGVGLSSPMLKRVTFMGWRKPRSEGYITYGCSAYSSGDSMLLDLVIVSLSVEVRGLGPRTRCRKHRRVSNKVVECRCWWTDSLNIMIG